MSDEYKIPNYVSKPTLYIEWVVALTFIIGGLYIMSPFFLTITGAPSSALYETLTGHLSLSIFGLIYSGVGFLLGFGIVRGNRRARRMGLYFISLLTFFFTILGWAVIGFRPLTWLSTLSVGIISGVIWLQIRWEDRHA